MDMRSGDTFEVPMGGKQPMQAATAAKVGFRELTSEESDLVRECREAGDVLRKLLDHFDIAAAPQAGGGVDIDKRWRAIAQTHFQEGLMALVRSVTRPAFF